MKFFNFSFRRSCTLISLGTARILKKTRQKNSKLFIAFFAMSIILLGLNHLPNNLIEPFSYGSPVISTPNFTDSVMFKDTYFDPSFPKRFNTVSSIVYYVNKHVANSGDKKEQLEILTKIIRKRFHHAYAVYGMQENWLAVFAGRFIWRDLSAKVIPDEILQDEVAACSQVSIVMMACCKELGMDTRRVELVGHYALEVKVDNQWFFVDANLKPNFNAINGRKSIAEIIANGEQYQLYANTILNKNEIKQKFSKLVYGKPNESPAPQAYLFQTVTGFLSHWSWLICLVIGIACQKPIS